MKKLYILLAIFGLMFIGTYSSSLAGNPGEKICFDAPATTTTVPISLDFGIVTCPAWCCYAWEIRTYESDGNGHIQLIDTHYFDCDQSTYSYNVQLDNGYNYIQTEVIATAVTTCHPVPPYSDWYSGWWDYGTYGIPPTWKPYICG